MTTILARQPTHYLARHGVDVRAIVCKDHRRDRRLGDDGVGIGPPAATPSLPMSQIPALRASLWPIQCIRSRTPLDPQTMFQFDRNWDPRQEGAVVQCRSPL